MNQRHIALPLLGAMALLAVIAAPAEAETALPATAPFAGEAAPSGWTWWCAEDETTCVMLPDGTAGTQKRFLLVTNDVQSVPSTMAGWVGGGEVIWEGDVKTGRGSFEGQIVSNGTIRGFIGMSDQWACAAVGLEDGWEATASVFNGVLRGEIVHE